MYLLNVELKDFSAAHRLVKGYQGKCNSLHGHNYSLKVVIASEMLGQDGLVIDFSKVRELSNNWVQAQLDHSTLVYQGDAPLIDFLKQNQQKSYTLSNNTTVEIVAQEIYKNLAPIFERESASHSHPFALHQVEVWESRQCGVIYTDAEIVRQGPTCGQ